MGTVKVDIGSQTSPGNLTTPPPVKLHKYLYQMVKSNLNYSCMEVSSHGIKLNRIKGVNFSVKIGTNISVDHFDLHPDFQEYLKTKLSFLKNNDEKTLVLINKDDTHLSKIKYKNNKQLLYGIYNQENIFADNIIQENIKTRFIYHLNSPFHKKRQYQFPVNMFLLGNHNIYNALIAITIALYYNISPQKIQSFFQSYGGVWRRLQIIYRNKFTIIDDCAHNPGSYNAVFKTITNLNYNNLYIINLQ